MNQYLHRVGKYIICALPLVCSACLLSPAAFAGGADVPYKAGLFPELPSEIGTENSELGQSEVKNNQPEVKKSTVTIFPTRIDFSEWQQTNQSDGTVCRSDGFNIVCFESEQFNAIDR